MALLINPATPVLWRSPHALQIGIDHDVMVFDPLSAVDESLIGALRRGVTAHGLAFIARAAGGTTSDIERLLSRLGPHLARGRGRGREETAPPAVRIDGVGPGAAHIARALGTAGITVLPPPGVLVRPDETRSPALVILVDRFVLAPERYRPWLSADVPHLPVLFGERTVTLGPLVTPGHGACLYCIEMHRTDADPSWPAMASQLTSLAADSETPQAALAVAARLSPWLSGPARQRAGRFAGQSVRLEVASGRVSRERYRPHAECACQALPENASVRAPRVANSPGATS